MNPRRKIDPHELRRLYLDEKLTLQQIATRLGSSETTIRRRLSEEDISKRPPGPQPRFNADLHCQWSPTLAYAVGLIVTDGNLSKDGRHLTVTSADRDLIETFRQCLGLDNQISQVGLMHRHYRIQWSDRVMYDWLIGIGLMPAKSRQLGTLNIPDEYFPDFVRGCLDGDGNIQIYTDRYNVFKNTKYVYERLLVRFVSASLPFLEWLQIAIERLIGIHGGIFGNKLRVGHSPVWTLKYAKHDSLLLLRWIYYSPDLPCLERKRQLALRVLKLAD